jgi:hypothetical protein
VLLTASGWGLRQIAAGFDKVQVLGEEMASGRQMHMKRLGFEPDDAKRLAVLDTRNFM